MKIDFNKRFIVAEIGNNHEGNFIRAKKMISHASKAGADAVKFQVFKTENFFISDRSRVKKYKKFEFKLDQFKKLSQHAKKNNIIFFSTPLDIKMLNELNKIQTLFKISSGDNNFFLLIEKILKLKKQLIISLGLTNKKDVSNLVSFIRKIKRKNNLKHKVTLLHCVSEYPAMIDNINLNTIKYLKKKYKDFNIGYSDHTKGLEACKIAYLLGAKVIEKHFTLDKNQSDFRDHKLSATPKEMKNLVNYTKKIDKILGQEKIIISKVEKKNLLSMRRSIYANKNINKNEKISLRNIKFIRPGNGTPLNKFKFINGKRAKRLIYKNSPIKLNEVE